MNLKNIAFWASTGFILFCMGVGGTANVIRQEDAVKAITDLGFPPYLATILGVWKILAFFVIALPGYQRLKEWAYAGAFFDFSGAAAAHLFEGSAAYHVVTTVFFAALVLVSWYLRPASRRLPAPGESQPQVAAPSAFRVGAPA